jgi:hypothetical protein
VSWFKPKSHGFGASPNGWKGWASIAVFILGETLLALVFVVNPAIGGTGPGAQQIIAWFIVSGLFTWLFLLFVKSRTDGAWHWRWGEKR